MRFGSQAASAHPKRTLTGALGRGLASAAKLPTHTPNGRLPPSGATLGRSVLVYAAVILSQLAMTPSSTSDVSLGSNEGATDVVRVPPPGSNAEHEKDPGDEPVFPREYELRWSAPTECPSLSSIDEAVRRLLSGPPQGSGVARMEAVVEVHDGVYRLTLESSFRGATEVHEVESEQCVPLAEAVALVIAIAIEPGLAAAEQEPIRDPAGEPGHLPETAPAARPPHTPDTIQRAAPESTDNSTSASKATGGEQNASPQVDPSHRESPTIAEPPMPIRSASPGSAMGAAFGLSGGFEIGAFGVPSPIVEALASVLWPRARLELSGLGIVRRIENDVSNGLFAVWAVGIAGCWRVRRKAWEWPLCLGAEAGQVLGRSGETILQSPWFAPHMGVGMLWGKRWWAIRADIEGVVTARGARFDVAGQSLTNQFPVSFRARIGFQIAVARNRRRPDNR